MSSSRVHACFIFGGLYVESAYGYCWCGGVSASSECGESARLAPGCMEE